MSNDVQVVRKLQYLMQNDNVQQRLKAMLDKNAETYVTSVINVVNGNKKLQQCEPMSILKSAMIAASLNLPVEPNLGMAALVPYKDKSNGMQAQFQMMWRGFVQLALRTGVYKTINVSEVYEDEIVKFNPFTEEIEFTDQSEWKMRYTENGKVVGYLAYFKLLSGFEKYSYMTKEEAEKHATSYSQSYKYDKQFNKSSSPWSTDFNSMGKKTVLKLLIGKFGPMSIQTAELSTAIKYDQAMIGGTIDNPEPEYVDNPEYEEPRGDPVNPFDKGKSESVNYDDIDDGELPDFLKKESDNDE